MDGAIDDGERIVLRPTLPRTIGLFAGAMGFVLLGFWLIPIEPVYGWLSIAFFGACGVGGVSRLVGADALEIGRDGIVVRRMFRSRALAWTDIGPFDVHVVQSQRLVVFQRADGQRPSAWGIANTWFTGANDWLDPYGRDAFELAALLNERRERALRDGSGA